MTLRVDTPATPGRYILAVHLVEEGVTWFSAAGAPLLRHTVKIAATGRRPNHKDH
jgi:hypothetical protein